MIALVDCNNFYASCERAFNPKFNGKPIVVLSNNDGCIIARSQEAKDLGIKMGEPAFLREKFLSDNGVYVFSSNYTLYGDMSRRVMNTLSRFSPNVEVYSIDEAFLDLSNFAYTDLIEYGRKIRSTVLQWTGIPVSVGVAPTKTLAKIANKLSKKSENVYVISNEAERTESLKATAVKDVWGVGGQYAEFLKHHNINTAYDLSVTSESWIRRHMSVVGVRTKQELQGTPCIELELEAPDKKNIATTRSFGEMLTEFEPIAEAVANHAAACAAKLRKQNSCADTLTVFIHTNPFEKDVKKRYARNRLIHLPVATNSTTEIVHYAILGLTDIYKQGYNYKKAGVIVSGLVPDSEINLNLFDEVDRNRDKKLMTALDELNNRFGREKVKVAAQGYGRKWRLKQEKLSPCYTTNWNDILTIKV